MIDGVEENWVRLGEKVVAARVAKGWRTREQLAQVAGFSTRLLGDIENGRRTNYDRAYLAMLEQALGWAEGSVKQILDGREPAPAPSAAPTGGASPATLDDEERDILDRIAAIKATPEKLLPERQKRAMIEYARGLLDQHRKDRQELQERHATERRVVERMLDAMQNGAHPAT